VTDSELVAALRPIAQALEALGVSYFLGGSVASSAHGIARASLDADVVAALKPEHIDALIAQLGADYYSGGAPAFGSGPTLVVQPHSPGDDVQDRPVRLERPAVRS